MASGISVSLFVPWGNCTGHGAGSTDTAVTSHTDWLHLPANQKETKKWYRRQFLIAMEINGGSNLYII